MAARIKSGDSGEITLPRELLEGKPFEEGDLLKAELDERGNVILRPLFSASLREYTVEDLETFAREDELPPELEQRIHYSLAREPRFYGR